jgi:hypothetical protein
MKKIILTSIILMLSMGILLAAGGDRKKKRTKNDTTSYTEILGKIVDNKTADPVVFATVVVQGTSIATVSNTDGEFVLKVPKDKETGNVLITHLGYLNSELPISSLNGGKNHIKLQAVTIPIDEVVIRNIDPQELLRTALSKVKENYSPSAEMQTSFYRETIKQNKRYVSVSEAVMDIYKGSYKSGLDGDRIRIYKGRKSRDVKKMDTLLVKLQGGPRTSLILDVVKHPGDILSVETFEYYEFELTGITSIDNRETYVISFDQKTWVQYPLYSGNIFIDIETTAIAGLDFRLSERGLKYASEILVKKKPSNLIIDIEKGHYLVRYRKDADNWYMNYVRSELALDSKWKKKLFSSDFNIMLEMAVTDRNQEDIEKFPYRESSKSNDVFAEKVSSFEDDDFWGEYNTIKPDESIEVAIKKLNKKLKRRQ